MASGRWLACGGGLGGVWPARGGRTIRLGGRCGSIRGEQRPSGPAEVPRGRSRRCHSPEYVIQIYPLVEVMARCQRDHRIHRRRHVASHRGTDEQTVLSADSDPAKITLGVDVVDGQVSVGVNERRFLDIWRFPVVKNNSQSAEFQFLQRQHTTRFRNRRRCFPRRAMSSSYLLRCCGAVCD